jgi:glutathione S-transferase
MMILRYSPPSPFVRKVRIAMSLLGLERDIELRETDLNDPSDAIRAQNPLGKIPALVLEDGTTLFDSRVILEYFDHLAGGGRIIPREPRARFDALRLQALCDGALDASVLIVYESRYRPAEMRVQSWVDRQSEKVARALAALEKAPAGDRCDAACRRDRARRSARLRRPALRGQMAQPISRPRRLARPLRSPGAGVHGEQGVSNFKSTRTACSAPRSPCHCRA